MITCSSVVEFLKFDFLSHQPVLDLKKVLEGQLVDRLVRHPELAVHLCPMLKSRVGMKAKLRNKLEE